MVPRSWRRHPSQQQPRRDRDCRRSREGIQDGDTSWLVVGYVARDNSEAVHQRCRGDLLVQRILRMRDPQLPPYLGDLLIEGEDGVSVIAGDRAEPTSKASRLREVTTMAHCFYALAQLADSDRREEQRDALRRGILEESPNTGIGAAALSRVADDVGVDQVHRPSRPPVGLAALEVGIFPDVGHCREYLGQRAALGPQQRLFEDFPMLLFGAVIAPGGALLELPHDRFVDVTDHELSHVRITSPLLAMLAAARRVGKRPTHAPRCGRPSWS